MGQQQSQRHGEPSALAALRALVPRRPLHYGEALRVAELQADLLLRLARIKEPPVPIDIVSRLPRMHVVWAADSPVAGSVHWDGHDWIIVVNSRQHEPRRRYSLAHEFKHVIDHTTRAFLYTGMPRVTAADQAERAADYFAGCLLMPPRQLQEAAIHGCRTAAEYASRFVVPTAAAEKRLAQLGLAPPRSRQVALAFEDTRPKVELETAMGPEA